MNTNQSMEAFVDEYLPIPYPDYNMGLLPDEQGYDRVQEFRNQEWEQNKQLALSAINLIIAAERKDELLWLREKVAHDDRVISRDGRHRGPAALGRNLLKRTLREQIDERIDHLTKEGTQ